jgi:hypothetical protein
LRSPTGAAAGGAAGWIGSTVPVALTGSSVVAAGGAISALGSLLWSCAGLAGSTLSIFSTAAAAASFAASDVVACANLTADPFSTTSAGFGVGTNSLACSKSTGATSWRDTITRTPSLVTGHSLAAKSCDMRMQPCEAG